VPREASVLSRTIMTERTRSWLTTCSALRDQPIGSLLPDHQTSAIPSILKPRSITGSTKTESGTKRIVTTKLRELRFICFRDSFFQLMLSESRQLLPLFTTKWSLEPDTSETHIKNLTLVNYHLVKSFKQLGTERSFSLEDLLQLRSETLMLFQTLPSLIRSQSLHCLTLVTVASWCALLFAHIWDAFQCHISELTRDGFASVTDLFMINSEESDKVQHKQTCHISTTLCTAQSSALRNKSSQTSHQSICTCEAPPHI